LRKKRQRILIVERKISALRVDAAHLGDVTREALDDYAKKMGERSPIPGLSEKKALNPGNSSFGAIYLRNYIGMSGKYVD
jgi:hypothetical protein